MNRDCGPSVTNLCVMLISQTTLLSLVVPTAIVARPILSRYLLSDVPDDLDDDLGGRARVGHAAPPVDVQVEAVALDERLSADLTRPASEHCPVVRWERRHSCVAPGKHVSVDDNIH